MDIIHVFGSNVRKYRTQKHLSQERFAELCGLHRTYISDIECFRRSISLDNIQKIADAPGNRLLHAVFGGITNAGSHYHRFLQRNGGRKL